MSPNRQPQGTPGGKGGRFAPQSVAKDILPHSGGIQLDTTSSVSDPLGDIRETLALKEDNLKESCQAFAQFIDGGLYDSEDGESQKKHDKLLQKAIKQFFDVTGSICDLAEQENKAEASEILKDTINYTQRMLGPVYLDSPNKKASIKRLVQIFNNPTEPSQS